MRPTPLKGCPRQGLPAKPLKKLRNRGGHSIRDLTLRRATQRRAYLRSAKPLKEIWNRGGHAISDLTYVKVTQKKGLSANSKTHKRSKKQGRAPVNQARDSRKFLKNNVFRPLNKNKATRWAPLKIIPEHDRYEK